MRASAITGVAAAMATAAVVLSGCGSDTKTRRRAVEQGVEDHQRDELQEGRTVDSQGRTAR